VRHTGRVVAAPPQPAVCSCLARSPSVLVQSHSPVCLNVLPTPFLSQHRLGSAELRWNINSQGASDQASELARQIRFDPLHLFSAVVNPVNFDGGLQSQMNRPTHSSGIVVPAGDPEWGRQSPLSLSQQLLQPHTHGLQRLWPIRLPVPIHSRLPPSSFFFSKVMFSPRPFSSLHSTSKATGMPASSLLVPLTMLS